MRIIEQECLEVYGYSLIECPKRKVCLKKNCLGRPLPWDSPTAKPYLLELVKENKDYFIQTDCNKCPFSTDCKTTCPQVDDFINRDQTEEPSIQYMKDVDNLIPDVLSISCGKWNVTHRDIPWKAINEVKQAIVYGYLYDRKSFKKIAEEEELYNEAYVKYQYYSAINVLSEFGIMQKFLKEKPKLTSRQRYILESRYIKYMSRKDIAKQLNISPQAIANCLEGVVKKFNLKWYRFVTKSDGTTPTYAVIGILSE